MVWSYIHNNVRSAFLITFLERLRLANHFLLINLNPFSCPRLLKGLTGPYFAF